jgi:hypothetical protein
MDRHAAEFSCPPAQVDARRLGGGAWLASGCGQRRTYTCLWTHGELRCTVEAEAAEPRSAGAI